MMNQEYDARRALVEHRLSGDPRPRWSTAALLLDLRETLLTPPWLHDDPPARSSELSLTTQELTQRSLDVDSLIRLGLRDRLSRAVLVGVLVAISVKVSHGSLNDPPDDAPSNSFLNVWQQLTTAVAAGPKSSDHLLSPIVLDDDIFFHESSSRTFVNLTRVKSNPLLDGEISKNFVTRALSPDDLAPEAAGVVSQWIDAAPLTCILDWEVPYRQIEQRPAATLDVEVCRRYRWIIERLTVTYPAQWATSSLHLEWKWQRSRVPSPADVKVMLEREVPPERLNAEIAERAVLSSEQPKGRNLQLDQLNDRALRLLVQGERQAAVTLFRLARETYPLNPEAQNNLGFCLIPDEPKEALIALKHADSLGYPSAAVNAVNRMQCFLLLGQFASALTIAEEVWAHWDDHESIALTSGGLAFPNQRPSLAVMRALARWRWPSKLVAPVAATSNFGQPAMQASVRMTIMRSSVLTCCPRLHHRAASHT